MRTATAAKALSTALLALLLVLAACGDDEPSTAVDAFDEGGEERVELVTGEPFEATGVVEERRGSHAFELYDALIVSPDLVSDLKEGYRVTVTGEVMTAEEVVTELRDQLGELTLEALAEEDVVVLASEIDLADLEGDVLD